MIHVFGFCLQSSSSAIFLQVSSEILFAPLLVLSADSVYIFADGGTRYTWIENGSR
jgi:membrane protein YqaA with SNARE-associated domain